MNSKEIERLEARAKAKGLTVWELEMSEAVGDRELADLRGDLRRSPANGFPSTVSLEPTRTLTEAEQKWKDDVDEVLVSGGIYPLKARADVRSFAAQCLRSAGGDMGRAMLMFGKKARQNGW
jgi:hypothetical protein